MIRHVLLFVAGALLALPASARAEEKTGGEKRALTIYRPETKGTKYRLVAKASMLETTDYLIGDERRPAEKGLNLEVRIEGDLEITNVTPSAGQVNGYRFTVQKMNVADGSAEFEGFKSGTVITAKPGARGRTDFVIDEDAKKGAPKKTVGEALEAALPALIFVDEETDDVFDPPGPVAPGEEWKPDLERYASAALKSSQIEIDVKNSTLTASYKGPGKLAGHDADRITNSYELKVMNRTDLAPGQKLKSGSMSSHATTLLARDVKVAAPLSEKFTRDSEFSYDIKSEDQTYGVVMKTHEELDRTMTPAK